MKTTKTPALWLAHFDRFDGADYDWILFTSPAGDTEKAKTNFKKEHKFMFGEVFDGDDDYVFIDEVDKVNNYKIKLTK